MTEPGSTQYRYWAFISYNKNDAKWGRWLHRAIETYGIPAQLVSHPTPAGYPAPKRFHPLFRDRDELPASADLGAQIEEALRASRYLIVVCSRHAAQSKWVNKEIETFQTFGRHGRILAVIVDGEPNAGDERECFPPALRQIEPIAADARPEGDGKTNAKLKLLAGMLGVSFDALKQRDAHRQIRRLQFAVVAALLVVMSLAGMAWYSNQQRNQAVKARGQAEDILEFVVYDLREPLKEVGRLDIPRSLQKRVEDYYRKLGVDDSYPGFLRTRSVAYDNEGDQLLKEGKLQEALAAYQQSMEIKNRLVRQNPTNAGWQRDLSVGYESIGDVRQKQGDFPAALEAFQQSLDISARLARLNPTNDEWQLDLSLSQDKVGDVLLAQRKLPEAFEAYRAGRAIRARLAARSPTNSEWQRSLSIGYEKTGDVLKAQEKLDEALADYRESMSIRKQLVEQYPRHAVYQRDFAVNHIKQGDVLKAQGKPREAEESYRQSLQTIGFLTSLDPCNAEQQRADWQRDFAVTHEGIGDVLLTQKRLTEAAASYQTSLQTRLRLAGLDQSNAQAQWDLAMIYFKMANLQSAQTNWVEVQKTYEACLAIRERLAGQYPENLEWQRELAMTQDKLGDVLLRLGKLEDALKVYYAALAVRKKLAEKEPTKAERQRDLCVSCFRIVAVLEQEPLKQTRKAEVDGFRRRAYDILSGMKHSGMTTPQDEAILEGLRTKLENER